MANLTNFDDLTAITAVAANDVLALDDTSESSAWTGTKKITFQNFSKSINTLNATTVSAATYDVLETDAIILSTRSATGSQAIDIPSAITAVAGRVLIIVDAGGNADPNNITISTEGSETIDGSATKVIATDRAVARLISDGSNWYSF